MARERQKVLLTRLELEVMRPFWEGDSPLELTVRDAVDRINAGRRKPLAYNTVQTVLQILREKGAVRARAGQGRAHLWQPRVSREQVTTSMVGELLERLFDGQVEPLLLNLVERESLSRPELERLRELIEERLDDDPAAGAAPGDTGAGTPEGGR
jgi:predicted transcriptional regulator